MIKLKKKTVIKPTENGKSLFSRNVSGTHENGNSVSSQYRKSITHLYTVFDLAVCVGGGVNEDILMHNNPFNPGTQSLIKLSLT